MEDTQQLHTRPPEGGTSPEMAQVLLLPTEARQAVPLGHMRYVLAISVTLIVAAFAIIYFMYF